ncbi:hypothetical protein, partial [Micromonospora sp. NPDC005172]|uniref:hypothetical protein n=1 Tax=Micromonospora sp. NPDC005172 TaxID=3156867 RepID=UPI0033B4175E
FRVSVFHLCAIPLCYLFKLLLRHAEVGGNNFMIGRRGDGDRPAWGRRSTGVGTAIDRRGDGDRPA